MTWTALLQHLYEIIPAWAVAVSLGLASVSLVIRQYGLHRQYLVSRPRALVGLTAVIISLAVFYGVQALFDPPVHIEGRAGFVRVLLILLGVSTLHWNWDYLMWAMGKTDETPL